jgi:hypothetical protein
MTTFTTTVLQGGKTATGLEVPPDVVASFGAGKRPAVTVTIGAHTYRSTVAVMGGKFMLPLSAENRQAAGVAAGDEVTVTLAADTAPRVVEVPADLASALADVPSARATFEALSYSNQRRHVLAVEGAKAAATRERRIAGVLAELTQG